MSSPTDESQGSAKSHRVRAKWMSTTEVIPTPARRNRSIQASARPRRDEFLHVGQPSRAFWMTMLPRDLPPSDGRTLIRACSGYLPKGPSRGITRLICLLPWLTPTSWTEEDDNQELWTRRRWSAPAIMPPKVQAPRSTMSSSHGYNQMRKPT